MASKGLVPEQTFTIRLASPMKNVMIDYHTHAHTIYVGTEITKIYKYKNVNINIAIHT